MSRKLLVYNNKESVMETEVIIVGDASLPQLNSETSVHEHEKSLPPNYSVQVSSEEIDISSQLDEFCQDFVTITISEREDQLYVDKIFKKNKFENSEETIEKDDFLSSSVKNTLDNCVNIITINRNERNGNPNQIKSFPCPLCQIPIKEIAELKNHLMKIHFLEDISSNTVEPSDEMIEALAIQIEEYECFCLCQRCGECEEFFSQHLVLLKHFSEVHPSKTPVDYYLQRPKSFKQADSSEEQESCICIQCGLLEQIGKMSSDVLVEVLLHLEGDTESDYANFLLLPEQYNQGLSDNQMEVSMKMNLSVACYSVSLSPINNEKESKKSQKRKTANKSDCICPILKCPECSALLIDFQALLRHVRLRHSSGSYRYHLALLWNKYKVIKEHCGWCCGFSVCQFVVCPHCPYLCMKDEDQAAHHMKTAHLGDYTNVTSQLDNLLKNEPKCKCEPSFECFTCNKFYRTPQGLHHHMRMMNHEMPQNFSGIPKMIEASNIQRLDCPRCSYFTDSKVGETEATTLKPCQCLWVKCNICGSSYKKFNALLKHISKFNHHTDQAYLDDEKKRQIESFKLCQRCNSVKEDRCCIFCNTKVTFLFNHMRTRHQDSQIMVINKEDFIKSYDEFYIEDPSDNQMKEVHYNRGKYQCSNCLKRFHYTTTLLQHARKIHPTQYFSLQSIILEETRSWSDISNSDLVRILAIIEPEETSHTILANSNINITENYFRNYSNTKDREYNRVNKKTKI